MENFDPITMISGAMAAVDTMTEKAARTISDTVDKYKHGPYVINTMIRKGAEPAFVVEMAVPGFAKEDVEIAAEAGILTISGKAVKSRKPTLMSFATDGFEREVNLPSNCKAEGTVAEYCNGVIVVVVPLQSIPTTKVVVA